MDVDPLQQRLRLLPGYGARSMPNLPEMPILPGTGPDNGRG